jgi:UDP-N-acetylmuramoyl-L-alanyl-D-glutamate--2,6-diaminopimelate ligase
MTEDGAAATPDGTPDDTPDHKRISDLVARVPSGRLRVVLGDASIPVSGVTHDSRAVVPGVLFACVVGTRHDGHAFARSAVEAGASALIVERELPIAVTQVVVDDTRAVLGHIAAAFHGEPSRSLTTVGITGTNGKTTTAHLIAAALRWAGRDVGVIGTLSGVRTTPEATELQEGLAGMRDEGVDAVVMEVSSHALALWRVAGTWFDAAVFTNLGRDHLDLHGSVEEYFRAKARLFTPELSALGVTNVDDPYGRLLLDAAAIPMVSYSGSDATEIEVTAMGHRFVWRDRRVEVPIGGAFNVMNSLAALTTLEALGVDADDATAGVSSAGPVPGRFEVIIPVGESAPAVIVDYAHTPDGITELLGATRQVIGSGVLTIVFGCGGGRDREKRPQMGHAAVAGADRVIVTSDNPRDEDPMTIIDAIVDGVMVADRARLIVEPDRRAAIELALAGARRGDVVVIAGKGHETTQTIGASVRDFDDRVVARELMGAES